MEISNIAKKGVLDVVSTSSLSAAITIAKTKN